MCYHVYIWNEYPPIGELYKPIHFYEFIAFYGPNDWLICYKTKQKLTCSPSLISNPAFGMSGYIINQSVSCSDHVLVLQNILLCVCRGEAICLLHVWHEVFPEIPPGEAHTHPYGYKIFLFLSLNTLFDFIKCCAAYYNSKWNSIVLTNFVFIFFLNATT